MTEYDFFVIGGGSGGVRAARIAASHGAKTAIAEQYRLGGTCVIRGCIPKKLFAYAAGFNDMFKLAESYGWHYKTPPQFNWNTLKNNKDQEINRLSHIYEKMLKEAHVDIFMQRATIEENKHIRLQNGHTIKAKNILIATGGTPFADKNITGIDHAITSNEAFHLTTLPKSILIIGGGYIAIEFAAIFNGMGVKTTLLYRGDKILRGFDDDIRTHVQNIYIQSGITIICNKNATHIKENTETSENQYTVTLDDGTTIQTDKIMAATGRHPNTHALGLEECGIERNKKGAVIVDKHFQTNIPGIYAVGDVRDHVNLTPVAIREGMACAETIFAGKKQTLNYDTIPTAVFSNPEIGTVGLSESAAREKYPQCAIYETLFPPLKHSLAKDNARTYIKLVVEGDNERIIGAHMIGEGAAEVTQILAITIQMGATKKDFDNTMPIHPTSAEEFVTLRKKTNT